MRRLSLVLLAGLLLAAGSTTPATVARFTASKTAAASLVTGSILPPTSLSATVAGTTVTLTWTPTTSTAVTGYDVLRSPTSGSGYGVVSSVTPRTASTTTNGPGAGTWYYVLRSVLQGWTSGLSNEASATVAGGVTGYKGCTGNAADTGGDGNGYETNPGSACVVDGAFATDDNSGTNNVLSCTDAGKDRHRFYGYAFGLPGTVSSVNGIQVSLEAGLNNNGGNSELCVQLSWDGGTTWTTAKQVALSAAAVATYSLGGSADAWGHTWTLAQLATTSFEVRVIDASTQTTKQFRLDGVTVQVVYTP